MIQLLKQGNYRFEFSKDHKMILYLDKEWYLWQYVPGIGQLLTYSTHVHQKEYLIVRGRYKMYGVKNEPKLVDLRHLELAVGLRGWQGYLLLTGLPSKNKLRSRIEPTREVIS